MRNSGCTAAAVLLLTLVIAGIAAFYFGYYDTPEARCSRGDMGACAAAIAAHPPTIVKIFTPAPTEDVPPPACGLGIAGHAMVATLDANYCRGLMSTISAPYSGTWVPLDSPSLSGLSRVCAIDDSTFGRIDVWDSGGQMYGTSLCQTLRSR